jgi:hypothetical protein
MWFLKESGIYISWHSCSYLTCPLRRVALIDAGILQSFFYSLIGIRITRIITVWNVKDQEESCDGQMEIRKDMNNANRRNGPQDPICRPLGRMWGQRARAYGWAQYVKPQRAPPAVFLLRNNSIVSKSPRGQTYFKYRQMTPLFLEKRMQVPRRIITVFLVQHKHYFEATYTTGSLANVAAAAFTCK